MSSLSHAHITPIKQKMMYAWKNVITTIKVVIQMSIFCDLKINVICFLNSSSLWMKKIINYYVSLGKNNNLFCYYLIVIYMVMESKKSLMVFSVTRGSWQCCKFIQIMYVCLCSKKEKRKGEREKEKSSAWRLDTPVCFYFIFIIQHVVHFETITMCILLLQFLKILTICCFSLFMLSAIFISFSYRYLHNNKLEKFSKSSFQGLSKLEKL